MSGDVRICSVGIVPDGYAARFDVDGEPICVVHLEDHWYAIGDTCSHADFSLSFGDVWPDELSIECPKHGSLFSLETGEPLSLPATTPVPVYPVRVDGDDVIVSVS